MTDNCPGPLIETKEQEINLDELTYIQKEIKAEDITLYNLKIYKSNQSIIFNIIQNDILKINYKKEYSLQQFFEINIFFKSFQSIQDIYTDFFENFDKLENKEIFIYENDYKLNVKFKFNYLRKIKEIIFDFDINIKNKVLQICNKIKEIEKINIKLKEINKEIEEQKIKLKNNDKILNEQINIIKNNKNELNKEIKLIKELQNIINVNNKNEIDNINKKIKDNENEINKNQNEIKNINEKKLDDIKKNIKENIKEIKDNENKEKSKLDNLSKKIEETKKFIYFLIFIIIIVIFKNVNILENNFKSTNKNVNNLENNIKSMNYKVNYIEDILENKPFISYISIKDYNIFKNLMNEGIKKFFNKKIKKYNLLYLASTDGYDTKYFHEKCDGKSFTVTLVITKENKIFGGFTELEWDQSGEYKEGNKGFIFSITNNKIYYNKNYYYIDNEDYYGPSFDNNGFYIKSNYGYDRIKYYKNSFDVSEEYFLARKSYFSIKDYAVYQIELV